MRPPVFVLELVAERHALSWCRGALPFDNEPKGETEFRQCYDDQQSDAQSPEKCGIRECESIDTVEQVTGRAQHEADADQAGGFVGGHNQSAEQNEMDCKEDLPDPDTGAVHFQKEAGKVGALACVEAGHEIGRRRKEGRSCMEEQHRGHHADHAQPRHSSGQGQGRRNRFEHEVEHGQGHDLEYHHDNIRRDTGLIKRAPVEDVRDCLRRIVRDNDLRGHIRDGKPTGDGDTEIEHARHSGINGGGRIGKGVHDMSFLEAKSFGPAGRVTTVYESWARRGCRFGVTTATEISCKVIST